MAYTSEKIYDDTYLINGDKRESMYLIIGKDIALLIDAGMEEESLKSYCETLTDKKIILAITHGHFDHISQAGEFDDVYMDYADKQLYHEHTNLKLPGAEPTKMNVKNLEDIKDIPRSFDLGDREVIVVKSPGHTPGSVLFVDHKNKAVYTGDAIGSGCGVLMAIGGSLCISEYKESLNKTIKTLVEMGVDDTYAFHGGHAGQEKVSRVSDNNVLNLQLMKDMEVLCDKLLNHDCYTEKFILPLGNVEALYAYYGKAEMNVFADSIH